MAQNFHSAEHPNPVDAIQIVTVTDELEKRLELNEAALEKVLMNEHIRDKPVAVISINGKFREGKSFLSNFLLQYLQKKSNPDGFDTEAMKEIDMESDIKQVGERFEWKNSCDRVTLGIYVSQRPFLVKLANGEEVAVLLLDTQGLFDNTMPERVNNHMFVLSTIISSHQVINVKGGISNVEFERLKFVAQYARYITEERKVKPYQTLKFLVRDWPNAHQYPFGIAGGNRYLQNLLQKMKKQVPKESQSVKDFILSCYNECDCYLFPHPGLTVATDPTYDGNTEDIAKEFIDHTKLLADHLFNPKNLQIKTINDVIITCKDLYDTIKRVVTVLQDENLLQPSFLFEATAEVTYVKALEYTLNHYDESMAREFPQLFPEDDELPKEDALLSLQDKLVANANQQFSNFCKMKFQNLEEKYNTQLSERIQERFNKWKFQFQQKVNINLQNSLKRCKMLLEDARKEAEKTKADTDQMKKQLQQQYLQNKELEEKISQMQNQRNEYTETIDEYRKQINQLETNLSLERQNMDANEVEQKNILEQINELQAKMASEQRKRMAVEKEWKESQTSAQANKRRLEEAENKIQRIQQQSQEKIDRLAAVDAKLEKVEEGKASAEEKQVAVHEAKSEISIISSFDAAIRDSLKELGTYLWNSGMSYFIQYFKGSNEG